MKLYSCFLLLWDCMHNLLPGTVLVLQGTTSAGKSSIRIALKNILKHENVAVVEIDTFLWQATIEEGKRLGFITDSMSLPEIQEIIMSTHKDAIFAEFIKNDWIEPKKTMHRVIKELAQKHMLVIVDTVHANDADYKDFIEQVEGLSVVYVQIYCSPDILAEHLVSRNRLVGYAEKRDGFFTLQQYCRLYQPLQNGIGIDVISMKQVQQALRVVSEELQESMPDDLVQEKIDEIAQRSIMIFLKIFKCVAIGIVVLLMCSSVYQYIATKLDARKYPPIGKLIDVDGYKLHMIDSAVSNNYDVTQPTVVLDSGIGSTTFDWLLVYPEIAKFARVIAYDRAGYGWSDVSPLPRTSANIVAELHAMLHNAGVQGPYILVGHSFGGLNVRLFAATYPDEVVGIVLVDALHESVMHRLPQIFIGFKHWIYRQLFFVYFGVPRIVSNCKSYFYPVEIQDKTVDRLHKTTMRYYRTLFSQLDFLPISCEQMKAARVSLPDVPVVVISEGKQVVPAKSPCGSYSPAEVMQINATWLQLQTDLVHQFSHSKQMIAHQSGHNIPHEQPQIIIDAIYEMVMQK